MEEVYFHAGSRYLLVRSANDAHSRDVHPHGGRLLTPSAARWALGGLFAAAGDALTIRAYRSLVGGVVSPLDGMNLHDMREALLDAAGRGRLSVYATAPGGYSVHQEKGEDDATPTSTSSTQEEKTWVRIVLMDDADPPQPVPFIRYRLELPDMSTREGVLDGNGSARLDGIDPGTCTVTFPNLDAADWS